MKERKPKLNKQPCQTCGAQTGQPCFASNDVDSGPRMHTHYAEQRRERQQIKRESIQAQREQRESKRNQYAQWLAQQPKPEPSAAKVHNRKTARGQKHGGRGAGIIREPETERRFDSSPEPGKATVQTRPQQYEQRELSSWLSAQSSGRKHNT